MSNLELSHGDRLDQARRLASLPEDRLKLQAAQACAAQDPEALWEIVLAYLTLYGENTLLTSSHTLRSYHTGVKQFVEYARENAWKLLSPRKNDPQIYINSLLARGRAIKTVENRVVAARTLYRALRWTGLTQADPFEGCRIPTERTDPWEKNGPYSLEEVEQFLTYADAQQTVLILLLAHAGLRISEALALEWEQVDHSRSRLVVKQGKGRKQRTVTISGSLERALQIWRPQAPHPRLFTFKGRSGAVKHLEKLSLQSGVAFRGFHAFRKFSGTELMRQVKDIARVARHLGHSDINTTRTYAHLGVDDLKTELQDW